MSIKRLLGLFFAMFSDNDSNYVITIAIMKFDTHINLSIGRDYVTCIQIGTEHARTGNQAGETMTFDSV